MSLSLDRRRWLGSTLRALRRAADLTQKSLGARAGLTPMRVYSLERGHAKVRRCELEALQAVLPGLADLLRPTNQPRVLGQPAGKHAPAARAESA
jgi:transcriptional regulator with XRE-family HTH domain